jgi:purine-binding chemotaxis protein CheW
MADDFTAEFSAASGAIDSEAEEPEVSSEGIDRAVAFVLAGQLYAIPIERVSEIQQIVAFSDTSHQGSAVVGMVNLRGHVIPAVDMRTLVGFEAQPYTLETPMIIVSVAGHTVALIVDEVQDVVELPPGCMQPVPPLHALASRMIGVCNVPEGLLNLLDIDRLLTDRAILED